MRSVFETLKAFLVAMQVEKKNNRENWFWSSAKNWRRRFSSEESPRGREGGEETEGEGSGGGFHFYRIG